MQFSWRFKFASLCVIGLGFLLACSGQPTSPPAPTFAAAAATSTPPPTTSVPPTATNIPPTATFTPSLTPSPTATLSQAEAISTLLASTRAAADATKTAQPTPDQRATAAIAQQTATTSAVKTATTSAQCLSDSARTPKDWSLTLCDLFDAPAHGWSAKSVNDDWVAGSTSIAKGRYEWEFTSKKGVVYHIFPRINTVNDFYSTTSANVITDNPGFRYGLVFRYSGGNYYFWRLGSDGAFYVSLYQNGRWTNLLAGDAKTALQSGQPNHLAIESHGTRYGFFVNGTWVGSIEDSRLTRGVIGLGVEFAQGGQKATIDFDNFVVLQPNPDAKPRPTIPPPAPVAARPTQPPAAQATQPAQNAGCPVDPGNAGILVVNDFDGLMTFTVANHEYKLEGHTQQLVQVPGGEKFTASVSVVGVGKTNFGPFTLQPGECVRYEPHAG
jgi:hypothetical protein